MPLLFKDEEALVKFVIAAKLPAWQVELFKKNSDSIQVHSEGQIFYKIDRLFPNEQPESKDLRILSFESVTEASFGRAANNVNRIFKNSSYTCEASEKTIDLVNEHNFEDQNFFNWFLDEWISWALKQDPNARIVVYPPAYVAKGKPRVVFVSSSNLVHLDQDAVIFISEDESEVDYETVDRKVHMERFYDQAVGSMNIRQAEENTYTPKIEKKIKRHVYHAFFKGVGMYRIEQLIKDNTKQYETEFFPFPGDFLPVTDAGGEKNKKKVNKSFLSPFVAFGNLALLQHSQHTAVNFIYSFPRMSEIVSECDAPGCEAGMIECVSPEELMKYASGWKPCSACRGSGRKSNQSPTKIYQKIFDPQGMEGDTKHLEVPDVQYYTPPVGILEYSKEEWTKYLEMAERAVYIQQKVQTGNVEAAQSKEIDRDDLYAFLTRVAQVYFQKKRFCIQMMENYEIPNPVQVSLQVPYSFAILSEGEAFAALKDILTSPVHVSMKANQVESFVNKFVSQSSPIRKFIDILKIVDPLFYYSGAEISSFKANMIITGEQYSNHVFSFPILQRMYFQNRDIFLQDTSAIIKQLQAELIPYIPPKVEDLKQKLLNDQ